MTKAQAQAWLERYYQATMNDTTHSCKYGHIDCSTSKGGPCLDETLGITEED